MVWRGGAVKGGGAGRNVTMSSLRSAVAQVLLISGMEERGEMALLYPTIRSPIVLPLLRTSSERLVFASLL